MHVMLDLETLGKRPGSVIRSIGAVAFDPVAGTMGRSFYANIDQASCKKAGLVTDADTIAFWDKQSAEAQAALVDNPQPLLNVLWAFGSFWKTVGGKRLWAHGATFDPPLLEAAYIAVGLPVPWDYTDPRDTRTIYELAGVQPDRSDGVHHHARWDAEVQAKAVIAAYRRLGLNVLPGGVTDTLTQAIAEADSAFGYNLSLTRLVDGASTHTLRIEGLPPAEFADPHDAYAAIAAEKNRRRAQAIFRTGLVRQPEPQAQDEAPDGKAA